MVTLLEKCLPAHSHSLISLLPSDFAMETDLLEVTTGLLVTKSSGSFSFLPYLTALTMPALAFPPPTAGARPLTAMPICSGQGLQTPRLGSQLRTTLLLSQCNVALVCINDPQCVLMFVKTGPQAAQVEDYLEL